MKADLRNVIGKKIFLLDGGTGTVLQEYGIKPGELSENWNLEHPDKIVLLQYNYYKAGSDMVLANSFSANILKFPLNLERVISAALENANQARNKIMAETGREDYYIAYDMTGSGKLLKPMGDLDFEDAVHIFKKSAKIAIQTGLLKKDSGKAFDCFYLETMNDCYETKALVLAVKEAMAEEGVDLPVFITNVYDKDCRLLSGSSPEAMVALLEGLGVDALGVNCSLGPLQMLETVQRLSAASSLPVIVKPNAGLPRVVNGQTVYDVNEADFADAMGKIIESGAAIIGGCCGTTPAYIKELRKRIDLGQKKSENGWNLRPITKKQFTVISSNTKTVYFGGKNPPVLIGERINPTGKKKFKEALRNNDIPYIVHQGLEQENAGAHVLDVNVGLPEIDEKQMMVSVMSELQAVTELPLQIDTSSPEVMEAALRRYNGKPLINSVNGKQEVMEQIFPIAKKYGGVIIGLTLDEDGIPAASERRIEIAKKIWVTAEKYGIPKSEIIIDPLAMAVSSDSKAGLATLQTVRAIHDLGGCTSLGISNVSFGLPLREAVTSAFFTMCMTNGLSAAIMNPLQGEMQKAYKTFCLLSGHDDQCMTYIGWAQAEAARQQEIMSRVGEASPSLQSPRSAPGFSATPSSGGSPRNAPKKDAAEAEITPLENAIIHGLKNDAAKITKELLQDTDSLKIINEHLIPGLDFVGKRFEQKTMYLPQLLMAAEAAKAAFGEIRTEMEKSGKKGKPKGTIIIATVKGDIHDIGKNIVKVLLENYDFEVIDLGKDVPPETIVKTCVEKKVKLVGLSALMTTTVAAMEETIKLLRKEAPWAKVCVGGAVLTQEYADMIGADFYGKDAMDTVRYASELFKS